MNTNAPIPIRKEIALSSDQLSLLCLIIVTLILFFVHTFRRDYTKASLAKEYGVTKTTFKKWVRFYCPDVDYSNFHLANTLDLFTKHQIETALGSPDMELVMTQEQIYDRIGSDYRTTRPNMLRFMKSNNYPEEAANMSKFPPRIAAQMVEKL